MDSKQKTASSAKTLKVSDKSVKPLFAHKKQICTVDSLIPDQYVVAEKKVPYEGAPTLFFLYKKDDDKKQIIYVAVVGKRWAGNHNNIPLLPLKQGAKVLIDQFSKGVNVHYKANQLGIGVPIYDNGYCITDDPEYPIITMVIMKRMTKTLDEYLSKSKLTAQQEKRLLELVKITSGNYILHNDMGVANIMLDEKDVPYLIDFESSTEQNDAKAAVKKWFTPRMTSADNINVMLGREIFLPYFILDALDVKAPEVSVLIHKNINDYIEKDYRLLLLIKDLTTMLMQIQAPNNPYNYKLLIDELMTAIKAVSPVWYASIQILMAEDLGKLQPIN
jgi:hypothetical protein